MPYQDVEDCTAAVARAEAAAERIRAAVDRSRRLCSCETWQGPPADRWCAAYWELSESILRVLDRVPGEGAACLAQVRASAGGTP
jgi:hypothetical protein